MGHRNGAARSQKFIDDAVLIEQLHRPWMQGRSPGGNQATMSPVNQLHRHPALRKSQASIRPVGPAPTIITCATYLSSALRPFATPGCQAARDGRLMNPCVPQFVPQSLARRAPQASWASGSGICAGTDGGSHGFAVRSPRAWW
jgi:hypothetical protein